MSADMPGIILTLPQLRKCKPVDFETNKKFDKLRRYIKKMWNHNNDRGNLYLTVKGVLFTILISSLDGHITVWDHQGLNHIASASIEADDINGSISSRTLDKIQIPMELWAEGTAQCHGCGKLFPKKDIAGGIFASFYCQECWDSEYHVKWQNTNFD